MAISDSGAVPNALLYLFSPGTILGLRFVKVQPSHRGLGAFLDALSQYTQVMSFAWLVNSFFYAMLIFALLTCVSKAESKTV